MKIIRIILSPLVFIYTFAALIVIPIGILALIMGTVNGIGAILYNEKIEKDHWYFTFTLFVLPYEYTRKFINAEPLDYE